MAKVVIDANVIISAAFGGYPLRALIRAMDEDEVYLSRAIERGVGVLKDRRTITCRNVQET
jgi:predicted nucleic acid-binding protein